MRIKCPHCLGVAEYGRGDIRVFVSCKSCQRQFRPNEASPLTGGPTFETPRFRRGELVATESTVGVGGAVGRAGGHELHNQRGSAFYHRRSFNEAETEFRKSLAINPEQPAISRLLRRVQALKQLPR